MPAGRPPTPPETVAEVRRRRRAGESTLKIAGETGVSKSTAWHLTRDIVMDARPAANRARAATEPAWLPEARRLLADDMRPLHVAKQLEIPKSTFYRAIAKLGAA